ncbi:MAG: hypothetical protein ACLQMO_09125 [Acidobacteriaceae bacterium]
MRRDAVFAACRSCGVGSELISVAIHTWRYSSVHIASVTLQPRQIQQFTSLEIAAE